MSKKKEYEEIVSPLLAMEKHEELFQYIVDNSNLPGKMANLTLISVLADWFEEHSPISETWYLRLMEWLEIENDGDKPETVVALESIGGIYLGCTNEQQGAIEIKLQQKLNDTRWRMRENNEGCFNTTRNTRTISHSGPSNPLNNGGTKVFFSRDIRSFI